MPVGGVIFRAVAHIPVEWYQTQVTIDRLPDCVVSCVSPTLHVGVLL